MLEEYKEYNHYSNEILSGLIFHLFTMIIKYKRENPDVLPVSFECKNKTIINALSFIQSHFHEDITMEDVCKYIGLTPSYFSKLFKDTIGTTYSEYVILTRLQCCRIMLMQTDLSVQEIAEKSGLCNGNYLSTLFKKYYHETPREFRNHCEATAVSDVINKPLYD